MVIPSKLRRALPTSLNCSPIVAIVIAASLLTGRPHSQAAPFSVRPVLFVPDPASFPEGFQPTPADLAVDMQNITAALQRVRMGYAGALGLNTSLAVEPVVRLDAYGGLSDYGITWNDPDRRYADGIAIDQSFWPSVLLETSSRGFGIGTPVTPYVNLIFVKGAGGYAGGAQFQAKSGGGNAILADWALDSLANRVPPEDAVWWWTGVNQQTSAIAHEVGHTLGLAHPDLLNPITGTNDFPYSFMGNWWDWPTWPTNPADPSWPLHGLHGWADNQGPAGSTPSYADQFLVEHRGKWFVTPVPEPSALGMAIGGLATGGLAALSLRRHRQPT
jgi:hypothetical protein